jgi:SpoVK/Ycf46/Vps4 family AAA+-type ATPase
MKANNITNVKNILEHIEHRYNPENDVIPGAPDVTWADSELMDAVKYLVAEIEVLNAIVEELRARTGA